MGAPAGTMLVPACAKLHSGLFIAGQRDVLWPSVIAFPAGSNVYHIERMACLACVSNSVVIWWLDVVLFDLGSIEIFAEKFDFCFNELLATC